MVQTRLKYKNIHIIKENYKKRKYSTIEYVKIHNGITNKDIKLMYLLPK